MIGTKPSRGDVCVIDGCNREHDARGWCKAHWMRWRKTGKVSAHIPIGGMGPSGEDVFKRHVVDQRPDGCWVWIGTLLRSGYGQIKTGGRKFMAHRWSYEHHVGPIPEGLVIDHLCRNKACVNPEHLEPVTVAENTRRGATCGFTYDTPEDRCVQGHEMTEENTYTYPDTSRYAGQQKCRACQRDRAREAYYRRMEVAS